MSLAAARRAADCSASCSHAGATLAAPRFVRCGRRPLAVVLDVDETALQNLGYEYDEALARTGYDQERWNRWEQTGANAVAAHARRRGGAGAIRARGRHRDLQLQPPAAICGADAGGDRGRRARPRGASANAVAEGR